MKKVLLKIDGMTCSACSSGLEKYLNKQDGIKQANVNLVMNNANIEYDEQKLTLEQVEKFIEKARRFRKVFGGGMRQAGMLAAAGIYALDHHIKRLATDHHHAKAIAEILQTKNFVGTILPVETNIIIFEVMSKFKNAHEFIELLRRKKMVQKTINEIEKI